MTDKIEVTIIEADFNADRITVEVTDWGKGISSGEYYLIRQDDYDKRETL